MIEKQILWAAIDKWGIESQIILLMEECAELTVALSHKWRGQDVNVIEEIADVQIMLDTLKLVFGEDEVKQAIRTKVARLKKRLGANENPFDYQEVHI